MAGNKDDAQNGEQLTPLQRYLAKQREPAGATAANRSGVAESPKADGEHVGSEARAEHVSATIEPAKPRDVSPQIAIETKAFREFVQTQGSPVQVGSGLFWPRVAAAIIDLIFVETIAHALSFIFSLGQSFTTFYFTQGFSNLSLFVAIFFYYGWFYSKRGASPGKMAMGLTVLEVGSGRRLGYWRAFFRETVGKAISGIILGIGFLQVAFRKDHLALHDMIFDTRVVKQAQP